MKKQKLTLEKMKNVLSNILSRDEMKEIFAGSGGGGSCASPWVCPTGPQWACTTFAGYNGCRCVNNPNQLCA